MNAGIQGLAADIFKVALVRVDQALVKRPCVTSSRLVLQVHDEVHRRGRRTGERERGQCPVVIDIMRDAAHLERPARGQRLVSAPPGPTAKS